MAFMMEKILNDARKLASRLKEHDGSTDNLVTQMTALNKKIDSMKTFQENLPDLNEMVLRKPGSTMKLGLSQENSQIRELEQENKELKQSLEEHELALELIMSRYRQQVAKLLVSNQVGQSMLNEETVQAQEVQDKAEHIYEMGSVMWKAIGEDDQSIYDTQQVLAQLKVENQGMRELLQICCSSGNPLRISDRQTQTGGLPLSSSASHNNSSTASSSAVFGAYGGGNGPQESTVVSDTRMKALKSLQPGERNSLSDGSAGAASKAGQESNEQTGLRHLGASACMLPSNAFTSHLMSGMQASNSCEKMPSSELYSTQMLATSGFEKQVSLGTGAVESPLSSLSLATDKSSEVQEQQPVNPSISKTKDTACSQETLLDPVTIRSPELIVENHTDINQIPNHSEMPVTDDNQSDPLVNSVTVSISATQEPDNSFHASSWLSNTTTASSSNAATITESALSQSRQLGSSALKNQTTSPKGATLSSSGKPVSILSGGTQKNPSSSGHVTPQRNANAATPSNASPTSRLKHGATTPSGMPSKTPTRSPVARDGTPGSPSGVAAVKLTSSGSPSVHSAKISTAAHPARVTPIRIKTTRKTPSVAASVASAATISSPSTITTSSVPLDSNGNNHTSTAVLNEISNINKMPNDAVVDGQ